MAFLNRVGSLLKNTVSKHVGSELSASSPSLFQVMRSMSTSSKLFIGGLSYSTDEPSLREEFAKYGEIVEARVIMDRETGRSRGFAFVTYTSPESAASAIQACDGQDLHGRRIRVNIATEKPRGGGFGGGGYGGGGGGYGGGGYQGGGGYGDGGGYGGGNQYPTGGGGGYGGGNQFQSGGGGGGGYTGFGGSGTNSFFGGQSGFSSPDETAAGAFGNPIQSDQIGMDAEKGDIVKDGSESDVPDDFANRR